MAFVWSRLIRHEHKFSMVDVQNATLAGGVALGAAADMRLTPFIAMAIGFVAGTVSGSYTIVAANHIRIYDLKSFLRKGKHQKISVEYFCFRNKCEYIVSTPIFFTLVTLLFPPTCPQCLALRVCRRTASIHAVYTTRAAC